MAIETAAGIKGVLNNFDSKKWVENADFKISKHPDLNKSLSNIPIDTGADKRSFGDFLTDSIGKVNQLQQNANVAIEKLATGESRNLHETLLVVEQADIAFRTMNQIRQKVLDAYKEVMRMQV
jgi:flagellar hook-basal body complex protein FliE